MFSLFCTDSPRLFPGTSGTSPQTVDSVQLGEYFGSRFVHNPGLEHIPKEHTASSCVDSSRPDDPSVSASSVATGIGKTKIPPPSISRPITNVLSPP